MVNLMNQAFQNQSKDKIKNFFVDEVTKVARYAVPFARNLKRMIGPSRIKTKKIDRTNGMPILEVRPNELTE